MSEMNAVTSLISSIHDFLVESCMRYFISTKSLQDIVYTISTRSRMQVLSVLSVAIIEAVMHIIFRYLG